MKAIAYRTWGQLCIAMAVTALILGCAAGREKFSVDVLYKKNKWGADQLVNRTVLVFPFLNRTGIDSAAQTVLRQQEEWFARRRPDLRFVVDETFAWRFMEQNGADSWKRLCRAFAESEVMSLQTNDTLWGAVGENYLLVLRITRSLHIKTYAGREARRLLLEAELWSKAATEVVWRVQVSGLSNRAETDDPAFVGAAIRAAMGSIPTESGPVDNEENW